MNALIAAGLTLLTGLPANAQSAPDAGQILQQNRALPEAPRPSVALPVPPLITQAVLPGGAQVTLKELQFGGNTALPNADLQALLAADLGKQLDMAGLRALAERVGAHYREAGYLFARAYLPPQDLAQGVLHIEVFEGLYGRARAPSTQAGWAEAAQPYLEPLQADTVIERSQLERATLLLNDLPGVVSSPVMQPGAKVGTGDLVVDIARGDALTGSMGLENFGDRYSGQLRASLGLDWNSPFQLGDKLSARAMLSNEKLWLGSLSYSMALGANGWRGTASYAHTSYQLAREFAAAGATGTAESSSVGAAYPLLRSNAANLKLSATAQHKRLNDDQGALQSRKTSQSAVLSLDFDLRDGWGGGGVSYGTLSMTPGSLNLSVANLATDVNNTNGRFDKFNLDVVRLQTLTPAVTGYARLSAQWANKNLDSSERMTLGGIYGVRAYPTGEGSGDQGWLLQTELRTLVGGVEPYAFADVASVRINAKPVSGSANSSRDLAGAGLGARMQWQGMDLNVAVAWSLRGGDAQADGGAGSTPRAWASAGYRF